MIKIIVGLGNNHKMYHDTRHNLGAKLLEEIAEEQNCSWSLNSHLVAKVSDLSFEDQTIRLVIPDININSSGLPIKNCLNYFNLKSEQLLVLHDELELSCGSLKYRFGGGHKGHNGLRNIIDCIKTADFYRLSIGIGRTERKFVSDYVLSVPTSMQQVLLKEAFTYVKNCLPDIVHKKFINRLL